MANLSTTDLSNATQFSNLISANPDIRTQVWSELVRRDSREQNVLKQFMGGENSYMPVCEKRDLKAGGSDKVIFTTVAPIRGQGVLGETVLKDNTDKLRFGTFDVQVDLLRHAVSYTQVLQIHRFTGKTLDQISAELMSGWYGRKEQDDIQAVLRETARIINGGDENITRIGNKQSTDDLRLDDLLDTETIEQSKQILTSLGAEYLGYERDVAGSEVPQYLVFGPDYFTKGLRRNASFLQQLREAGVRDTSQNDLFTGRMPLWDNNLIFNHQIKVDTAQGRQGSPLAPVAFVGQAIANASATTITGGGSQNSAGSINSDFFAYFPGYNWKIVEGDTKLQEAGANEYYALIYNLSTDRNYEIIKYTAADNDGVSLTSVTREVDETGFTQKTKLQNAGRYSASHPTGSIILPCNRYGVPYAWALHMGANALYFGKGYVDMEQIFHYDDFANAGNRAHVTAMGIQSVRGMSAYEDTNNRFPNFNLIEGAITYPGLDLVDLS